MAEEPHNLATNASLDNSASQLKRVDRELNVLYEVSCAMRTTLELKHVLYIILTGVTSHSGLGYNRALLFLVNNKNRSLECQMAIGPESGEHANKIWEYIENSNPNLEDLIQVDNVAITVNQSTLFRTVKDLKLPLDESNPSLLTKAYFRGTPWLLSPQEISQYTGDPLLRIFSTNELVIMPLRAKDNVNGLIIADNIYTRKPISDDDIRIFTMLANQAGLAIENSHLYEMVVQKSLTDPVTGLWNHRFFQETLAEEIKRAQKNNHPLSLAIIDIDNFKILNDTYGHQHGDRILKELAHIFRDSSREVDYVCRYGGEEFAIIFIGTRKNQGFDIAERLRARIEQHKFPTHGQQEEQRLTVSIGLSGFPDDAITKEDLIAQADKAMYIAKFSGKNKTYPADTPV